jgi:hypothetical protein
MIVWVGGGVYNMSMIITMREQAVIKAWNKKGLSGLRVSSLELLENIGGVGQEGVSRVLLQHTVGVMPEGLWGDAERYCREICFLAGAEFKEEELLEVLRIERSDREDVEFED